MILTKGEINEQWRKRKGNRKVKVRLVKRKQSLAHLACISGFNYHQVDKVYKSILAFKGGVMVVLWWCYGVYSREKYQFTEFQLHAALLTPTDVLKHHTNMFRVFHIISHFFFLHVKDIIKLEYNHHN